MLKSRKSFFLIIFISLLLVIFVSLTAATSLLSDNIKLDMTDNRRYSLSPASKKIASELQMPVYIKIYLSTALTKENPQYSAYAPYVLRYLKKFRQAAAHDRIKIEIVNPEPYSALEEEAKRAGLKPLTDAGGQSNLYFGAVISTGDKFRQVIPNFTVSRSGFLETDISRILAKINEPTRQSVGLISPSLPLISRKYARVIPNWAIVAQLQNDYNIVALSDKTVQIPGDIKVLIVVNPAELSPLLLYALDQYVLRGGKILVLSDVFSEKQAALHNISEAESADMNRLFRNWGFELDYGKIVGSSGQGEILLMNTQNGSKMQKFPFWMRLNAGQINQHHPLTAGLKQIRVKTAGALFPLSPSSNIKITPLLKSGTESGQTARSEFMQNNQSELSALFRADDKEYILALLAEGHFDSLFSNSIFAGTYLEDQMFPYLPSSIKPAQIIVVADSDLLVAENWADTSETVNNPVYGLVPVFDNGTFILRAVDFLVGKKELLGLNNKEPASDKTVGQAIYNDVFNLYAGEYELLQQELNERSVALQNASASQSLQSPDQMKLINQNKLKINELKEKLKQKEYQIKKENEKHLNTVIMTNTVIIPLIIILIMILVALGWRRRYLKTIKEIFNEFPNN